MRATLRETALRVYLSLARAVVVKTNDKPRMQELELDVLAAEHHKQSERYQNYGRSSVPHPENKLGIAEAVAGYVQGNRSHVVVVVCDDRRFRIAGLQEGESIDFDDQGHQIHITRDGIIVSAPHDKTVTVRLMKKKAGKPDDPTTLIQSSKTSLTKKDEVQAEYIFDKKTFKVIQRDKQDYDDEKSESATIEHQIVDKDGNVLTSMKMDATGIVWAGANMTHNAPNQNWNGKVFKHDAANSHDLSAIRTTVTTKKPNDDEKVSVVETVHPPDQGGITLIGMEKSKDEQSASKIVTDDGDAKHAKALPQ
jgi:phage baseplate assembly protein V